MATQTTYDGPHQMLRRYLADMRRQVIPAALLKHPELARLDEERRRLVTALEDAERSGPKSVDDAGYISARAKALREGSDLPPAPPTAAEVEAGQQQRNRDVQAATDALMVVADEICDVVRQHPEWTHEARGEVATLARRAEELRQQAVEAERQAAVVAFQVQWLSQVERDYLYVPTGDAAGLNAEARRDAIQAAQQGQPH
jgi:hypothetical protein